MLRWTALNCVDAVESALLGAAERERRERRSGKVGEEAW